MDCEGTDIAHEQGTDPPTRSPARLQPYNGHGLMSAEAQSGILEDLPAVLDRMAPEDFVRESQGPGISNLAILGGQSTRAAKKAAALQNENRPVRVATPRHFARGGSASNGPLMTMRAQLQRGPSLDPRRDSTSAASDLSMANDQDVADAVSQFDTRHCEMQLDEYVPLEPRADPRLSGLLGYSANVTRTMSDSATGSGPEDDLADLTRLVMEGHGRRERNSATPMYRAPNALLSTQEIERQAVEESALPSLSPKRSTYASHQDPVVPSPENSPIDSGTRDSEASDVATASTPVYVTVLRHGPRLDEVKEWTEITDADWSDRKERPHDTPLAPDGKTAKAIQKLRTARPILKIISSPFRRCLQTAAVAARALGVSDIKVDLRLAETDVAVRRDFQKANVPYSPSKHTHISYEDAANLLGPEQTLEWDGSQMDGSGGDHGTGVIGAIRCAIAEDPSRRHILLVTHGDLVNEFSPPLGEGLDIGRYRADVAGWVSYELPTTDIDRPRIDMVVDRYHVEDLAAEGNGPSEDPDPPATSNGHPDVDDAESKNVVARLNEASERADRALNEAARARQAHEIETHGGSDDDLSDWANVSEAEGSGSKTESGAWYAGRALPRKDSLLTDGDFGLDTDTDDAASTFMTRGPATQNNLGRRRQRPAELSKLEPISGSSSPSPTGRGLHEEDPFSAWNETVYNELPNFGSEGPTIEMEQVEGIHPSCPVHAVADIPVVIRNYWDSSVLVTFGLNDGSDSAVFRRPTCATVVMRPRSNRTVHCKFVPVRPGPRECSFTAIAQRLSQSGELRGHQGPVAQTTLRAVATSDQHAYLGIYPHSVDFGTIPPCRVTAQPFQVSCDREEVLAVIEVRGDTSSDVLFLSKDKPDEDAPQSTTSFTQTLSCAQPTIVWVCIHPRDGSTQGEKIDGMLTVRLAHPDGEDNQLFSHIDAPGEASECFALISANVGQVHLEILASSDAHRFHTPRGVPLTKQLPIRNTGALSSLAEISFLSHADSGIPPFTVSPESLELGPGQRTVIFITYHPQEVNDTTSREIDIATLTIVDSVSRQVHNLEVTGSVDQQACSEVHDEPQDHGLSVLCSRSNVVWPGLPGSPIVLQIKNNSTEIEPLSLEVLVDDPDSGFTIDDVGATGPQDVAHGAFLEVPVRLRRSYRSAPLTGAHLLVKAIQRSLVGPGGDGISTFRIPMLGYNGACRIEIVGARIGQNPVPFTKSQVQLGNFSLDKTYTLVLSLKNQGDRAAAVWTTVTDPSGLDLRSSQASASPPTMAIRAGRTRTVRVRFRPDYGMLQLMAAAGEAESALLRGIIGRVTLVVADEVSRVCMSTALLTSDAGTAAVPPDVRPFCRYFDGEEIVRGRVPPQPAQHMATAVDLFRAGVTRVTLNILGSATTDIFENVAYGTRPRARSQRHTVASPERVPKWEVPEVAVQEVSPARSDGTVVLDTHQSESALVSETTTVLVKDTKQVLLRNTTPSTTVEFEAMCLGHNIDVAPNSGSVRPGDTMPLFIRKTPQCEPFAQSRVYVLYSFEGQRHQIAIDVQTESETGVFSSPERNQMPQKHPIVRPARSPPNAGVAARLKSSIIDVGATCAGERASEFTSLRNVGDETITWVVSPAGPAMTVVTKNAHGETTLEEVSDSPFRFRRQSGTVLARETVDVIADFLPKIPGDYVQLWHLRLIMSFSDNDVMITNITVRGVAVGRNQRSLIGTILRPPFNPASAPKRRVSSSAGMEAPRDNSGAATVRSGNGKGRVTVEKTLIFAPTAVNHSDVKDVRVCNRTAREVEVAVAISEGSSAFLLRQRRVNLKPQSFVRIPVTFEPPVGGKHVAVMTTCVNGGRELATVLKGVTKSH